MSGYLKIPIASGGSGGTAADTTFDPSGTGLSATNVQDAIVEVVDDLNSGLTEVQDNLDNHINDTTSAHAASAISYDNSSSNLTATDVQAAIDEVLSKVASNNIIYVTKLGNDTTGNGSYAKPYLTVAKAVSVISAPSSSNRYSINVGIGTFVESTLTLKPWTWICGQASIMMGGGSRINVSSGSVTLDSSWASGSQRGGFVNLYMTGSTGINFDRQTISGSGSVVYELFNVGMNGGLNVKASQNTLDFVDAFGIRVFGASTISGGSIQLFNSQFLNNVTLNTDGTQNLSAEILYSNLSGNLTVTSTLSNTATVNFIDCRVQGTKTYSGSGTTVTTDLAYYKPTNESNWSSVPSTVNEALDTLAGDISGSTGKYEMSFNNTSDWTLNSDYYEIEILESTHGKGASPNCKVYENITSIFYLSYPSISMNSSGDLYIKVTASPDNRFAGKLTVQ